MNRAANGGMAWARIRTGLQARSAWS